MTDSEEVVWTRPLSASSISLFEQCPLKWKFRYIDQIPEPPGAPAVLGTFVHSVLENLMQLARGTRSVEAARSIATEEWGKITSTEAFFEADFSDKELLEFRQFSWRKITGLWELEDPDQVNVLATEMKIDRTVDGVPFIGFIDRLDEVGDNTVVVDLKSGKAPDPRYEDDKTGQLLMYAAAIDEIDEVPNAISIKLLYLGDRAIERDVTKRRIKAQHKRLHTTWDSIHEGIATDAWKPLTGPLCAWCPYVDRCPAGIDEVERRFRLGRVREDAPALTILGLKD